MNIPGGNRCRIADAANCDRRISGTAGAVTQLTMGIPPPATHAAIGKHCTSMNIPGGNLYCVADAGGCNRHRIDGSVSAVPQLTLITPSPAAHAAISKYCTSVENPDGNRCRIADATHYDRRICGSGGAVTQLAVPVHPPAAHAAIGKHRAGVGTPGGKSSGAARRQYNKCSRATLVRIHRHRRGMAGPFTRVAPAGKSMA